MARAKVLFTSAGSLVVTAILDALGDRRAQLDLQGVNSVPAIETERRLNGFRLVPPLTSPGFAESLMSVVNQESPDLIIPGRDDDVVALTDLARKGILDPALVPAGSHACAVALRDTGLSAEFARSFGLPFVTTVLTGTPQAVEDARHLVKETPGPWVIKPRRGQASRGVLLTWSTSELLSHAERPRHVIQPLLGDVPGAAAHASTVVLTSLGNRRDIDAQVVLGPDSEVLAVATFISDMADGKVTRVERLHLTQAEAFADSYARALASTGWRGPVNIQASTDWDGSIKAFEVNPRFGGGTGARRRAGFDEVGLVLRSFLRPDAIES